MAINDLSKLEVAYPVAYGVDASLRHGSIIKLTKSDDHFSWKVIYEWNKKGPSLGEKATLQEIADFSLLIGKVLAEEEEGPFLIEFDPRSVYWRSGKRQIVTLSTFLGYLVSVLHVLGLPVVFVTPEESRRFYGFTKGKKEEFQSHFIDLVKTSGYQVVPSLKDPSLKGSDHLDAILIGMTYWDKLWSFAREGTE